MATQDIKPTITIRNAREADIEQVIDFIKPFIGEGRLLPRTFRELEEWLPNMFIAVHEDGEIVGCAALEVYNKKLAEIRSLAVSPRVQGMGVGKALVNACVDLAREQEIYEVLAVTSSDAFFMACGFDYTLPGEKRALFMQTREKY